MIRSLSLRGFRNLEEGRVTLGPGRSLFLGANGAGKTSLLEALYIGATTRSFRSSRLAPLVQRGREAFWVRLEVEDPDRRRSRLEVSWGSENGLVRSVDGETGDLSDHLGRQPVIVWSAADRELLSGAPDPRRRLLDRVVLGLKPSALARYRAFRRALAQKRELLRAGGDEGTLSAWNDLLARDGAEITAGRAEVSELLSRGAREELEGLDSPLGRVSVEYRPSGGVAPGDERALREALEGRRTEERRRGQALLGPHRDRVRFTLAGKEAAEVASAGEGKALGLALVLAHGRILERAGRSPTYLLDDVDTELDPARLAWLWRRLDPSAQVLATSAREAVWDGLETDLRQSLDAGSWGPAEGPPTASN